METKAKAQITLATLEKATEQEVFDQVVGHLRRQGRKSRSDDMCLYRGPEGLMCAAGCLMTDEEAELVTEDKTWMGLVEGNVVPQAHAELVQHLQNIHDADEIYEWETRFAALAGQRGLTYTPPAA